MTTVKTRLNEGVPPIIAPIAQKWAEALDATMAHMQEVPTSEEDMQTLFAIILETAGAVFAPGDLNRKDQKEVVARFKERLAAACDQFRSDRDAFLNSTRPH